LFIASRRKDTRRERKKQQSEREKESSTNGRTENERKEKHSKARACVGEKTDFKNFQNATRRVCTHLLKERARKGSRPKRQSEQKRRRNKTRTWRRGEVPQTSRVAYFWSLFRHLLFFARDDDERFCVDANEKKNKRIRFV